MVGPSLHLGDSNSWGPSTTHFLLSKNGPPLFPFPRCSLSSREASSETLSSQDTDPYYPCQGQSLTVPSPLTLPPNSSHCLGGQANAPLLSAADIQMTQKNFSFAKKFSLPLYFVSAADGTNVVKLFNDAIRLAVAYKESSQDFMDEVLQELENFKLEQKEEDTSGQEQSDTTKSPSPS